MSPQLPVTPRAVADKAREAITRLRTGTSEGRRSLAIRRPGDEILRLWNDQEANAAVLAGLPVAEASLNVGDDARDWGTTVSVQVRLETAMPRAATQALAGKVLRRLKALAETGEVPTTERNPSYRPDAGEASA